MKKPCCALVAIFLSACGSKYDGTAIPVLQPVPNTPGRYFDQGVSAWHYVHAPEAPAVRYTPEAAPTFGAPTRLNDCPPDISRQVCQDWIKNGRKRR